MRVLRFSNSPNSSVKMFWGVSEVGENDFSIYFRWLCVFFLIFSFPAAIALRCADALFCGVWSFVLCGPRSFAASMPWLVAVAS